MLRSRARLLPALLCACLAAGCPAPERAAGPRVVLIGLDGADWEPIDALLERGRLPALASLVRGGTRGLLHTIEPMLSPLLWTTIATGRTPPEHGILDFFALDAQGRRVPVPSHRRRVRALWNVAGDYGHAVAFVGWLVTHPAERVAGAIVSDRVLELADSGGARGPRGITWPAGLERELRVRVVLPEAIPDALLARFVRGGVREGDPLLRQLRLVLAHTETVKAIALDRLSPGPALLGVYFPGIDEVSHLFARFAPPPLPGVGEGQALAYGGVVEEFYVYQDEVVGEILAAAGPEATVFVVSDHGFRLGRARPPLEPSSKGTPYAGQWHRDHGVIVAKGPGIRSGGRLRGASILDVAPTVLARLGIPAGEDMGGRVLHELWASPPSAVLERIPTHDRPGWHEEAFVAEAADEAGAAEALAKRLRALGYLGPGQGADDAAAQAATELANLAGYHLRRGELEPALAAATGSIAEDPANYEAHRHLAALYRGIGDRSAALAAIERAIALREGAVEPRLYRVELLRESGALEEARRAAASLAERHPGDARVHNLLGRLHAETGAALPAIRSYQSSLALDPGQEAASVELLSLLIGQGAAAEIDRFLAEREPAGPVGLDRWLALAKAYLRQRDLESALRFVELSLRDRPGAKEGYLCRGIVLGERREYARSVADFDRALSLDPDYAEAHFNAGVTHLKAGDPARAVASLEAAAALLPSSDPILANLGKAYALAGDAERARQALAEALRINPGSELARATWAQVAAGEGSRVPERGDAP